MKSVIYARVSSKEQEETGYSLPAQEKFLREYAAKKDFDVSKVFAISESASGTKQREVFGEMLRYTIKHEIKLIICEKSDRLTRNFKDAVTIDEWLEENDERQVHLVKDSLVLHKNARSQEKLNWGVRIIFAKNYIDNLSEEVKKGLGEKLRQGWLPTKPPMGYKTIGEKGHKIHIVNEETAPIVRRMFELYATSQYSLLKLREIMLEAGLRSSKGRMVTKSRIATLLADPFYIGKIRYNGAIHQGKHEPLISEEMFERVQQVLHNKTTPHYCKHSPLFRGMITCEECRGLVTWQTQKDHWYGHCNYYRQCTRRPYVRQEIIEKQLLPNFGKMAIKSSRLLEWIKKALKENHQEEIAYNTSAREELNRRYETAQRRLEMIYDDKLDGKITQEFYEGKFKQYTEEKETALSLLKKHNEANTKYYELGASVIELASKAREIYLNKKRTVEDRRILLNLIFSNLGLQQQELRPSFTKAFQVLTNFVPAWNEVFEPQKTLIEQKEIRATAPISASMLRRLDSNQGPSP